MWQFLFYLFIYYLEHQRCCSRREVETFANVALRIILWHVAFDHDRLGCSLLSNQQNSLWKYFYLELALANLEGNILEWIWTMQIVWRIDICCMLSLIKLLFIIRLLCPNISLIMHPTVEYRPAFHRFWLSFSIPFLCYFYLFLNTLA